MNTFYFFTFIPLLMLGFTVWLSICKKKEYGKRRGILLFSLVTIVLMMALQLFLDRSLENNFPQRLFFILVSLSIYNLIFFLLEYSIHIQRIEFSYLTKEVKPSIRSFFIWFFISILLMLFLFRSQIRSAEDSANISQLVLGVTVLPLFIIDFLMIGKVFEFKKGVLRKRKYPFIAQLIAHIYYLVIALIARYIDTVSILPLILINLILAVRIYEEYLYHRTLHLGRMLKKQEQIRRRSNELISEIIISPAKDDGLIINKTMKEAVEQTKEELINEDYGITGIAAYRLFEGKYKVDSPESLFGHCSPLRKVNNLKIMKPEAVARFMVDNSYEEDILLNTSDSDLSDWGDRYIKEMLQTHEIVKCVDIPEYMKGLQKLVVFYPILNNDEMAGFLVVYKDAYSKLYPHEKNILEVLGYELNTLFSIHFGKFIQDERNRLEGEMDIAKEIQTSIVPKTMTLDGYTIACSMETATEVGGDAFDYIKTQYGNYFSIGDVSGHGLPSGIMALIFISSLQAAAKTSEVLGKELSSSDAYDVVNKVLCEVNRDRIGSDKFMTGNVFLEKNGVFSHAGAHEIAVQYSAESESVLEHHGCTEKTAFLGLSEFIQSKTSLGEISLKSGDILVLYSDGVIEAKDRDSQQYGVENLKNLLLAEKDSTPEEIIQQIGNAVKAHAKFGDLTTHKGNLADDISLVVIKKD